MGSADRLLRRAAPRSARDTCDVEVALLQELDAPVLEVLAAARLHQAALGQHRPESLHQLRPMEEDPAAVPSSLPTSSLLVARKITERRLLAGRRQIPDRQQLGNVDALHVEELRPVWPPNSGVAPREGSGTGSTWSMWWCSTSASRRSPSTIGDRIQPFPSRISSLSMFTSARRAARKRAAATSSPSGALVSMRRYSWRSRTSGSG